MSLLTIIRRIIAPFILLGLVKKYEGKSSLMKIRAAQAYVVGVKKIRILCLGSLFVILSFFQQKLLELSDAWITPHIISIQTTQKTRQMAPPFAWFFVIFAYPSFRSYILLQCI